MQVLFWGSTNLLMMIGDGFCPERCAVLKGRGRRAWEQCGRIVREVMPWRDNFTGLRAEEEDSY